MCKPDTAVQCRFVNVIDGAKYSDLLAAAMFSAEFAPAYRKRLIGPQNARHKPSLIGPANLGLAQVRLDHTGPTNPRSKWS